MTNRPRFAALLVVALAAMMMALAACGDDDDSGDAAPAAGTAVADAAPADLEIWQTDLNAVGCYAGAVDGTLGPQTEAAVRAFQQASGLTVDGVLGPATEEALEDAVATGTIVCTEPPAAEEPAAGDQASLSSPSYDNTFALTTCSLEPDLANMFLEGSADGLAFTTEVVDGEGTVAVTGGNEQDGITLNGAVDAVEIGADRSFTATGAFGAPNFAGEEFTISGACPE